MSNKLKDGWTKNSSLKDFIVSNRTILEPLGLDFDFNNLNPTFDTAYEFYLQNYIDYINESIDSFYLNLVKTITVSDMIRISEQIKVRLLTKKIDEALTAANIAMFAIDNIDIETDEEMEAVLRMEAVQQDQIDKLKKLKRNKERMKPIKNVVNGDK